MKLGLQARTRKDSLVSRLSKLVGRTNLISFHKVLHLISYKICREKNDLIKKNLFFPTLLVGPSTYWRQFCSSLIGNTFYQHVVNRRHFVCAHIDIISS